MPANISKCLITPPIFSKNNWSITKIAKENRIAKQQVIKRAFLPQASIRSQVELTTHHVGQNDPLFQVRNDVTTVVSIFIGILANIIIFLN